MSDTTVNVPAPLSVMPPGEPVALASATEPIIHGLVGAYYGDLEVDIGKSVRWLEFYTDDIFITDINTGEQRYWVVNWAESFLYSEHVVTGRNFFLDNANWRREQFEAADSVFHYQDEDWCLFVDGTEAISFDTRSLPTDYNVSPFMSWVWREVARAVAAGKDTVVLPFYAYLKNSDIQNIVYGTKANQDNQVLGIPDVQQAVSVPWYLANKGLPRLFKVSALRAPGFDWTKLDKFVDWDIKPGTGLPAYDGYLDGSVANASVSTPDPPDTAITDSVLMTWKVRPYNLTVALSEQTFGSQWGSPPYAWYYSQRQSQGGLIFGASFDGVSQNVFQNPANNAAVGVALPDGVDGWTGLRIETNAGRLTALTSTDGVTWTPFGVPRTIPPFTLIDSTQPLRIGTRTGATGWLGRIYSAEMKQINQARLALPGATGNYLSIPDAAILDITNDIEIVLRLTPAQVWRPTTLQEVIGKYDAGAPGNRSYRISIGPTNGNIIFTYSPDGVSASQASSASAPTDTEWVKITRVAATGVVQFWTTSATAAPLEPTSWLKLGGDAATPPGLMYSGTAPVIIGQLLPGAANPYGGLVRRAIVRNGIGTNLPQIVFSGVAGNYLQATIAPAGADVEIVARISSNWSTPWGYDFGGLITSLGAAGTTWSLRRSGLTTKGLQYYFYRADGTAGSYSFTLPAGVVDNQPFWLRLRHTTSTGAVVADWAADAAVEPTTWTNIGSTTSPTTGALRAISWVRVGIADSTSRPWMGRVQRITYRDGIAGTTRLDIVEANASIGATSFTASTGGAIAVTQRVPTAFVFNGVAGNNLSTPDAAGLRITGDITVIAKISMPNWATGSGTIAARYTSTVCNYLLQMNTAGRIIFIWSPDGTVGNAKSHTSGTVVGLVDGQPIWVGVTLDVDNGASGYTLRFWQSPEGATWTQVGANVTVAGVTSIFAGTHPLFIGQRTDAASPFTGTISRVIIRNGIAVSGDPTGGTLAVDLRGDDAATPGVASFNASTGGTFTAAQTGGWTVVQQDPGAPFGPIIQGTVLDVSDNNAGTMTDATHFTATSGQVVTVNNTSRLVFPGIAGNYIQWANIAAFAITGSLEIVVRASLNWMSATEQNTLVARYSTSGLGGRSYYLWMDAQYPGRPRLSTSPDGVAGVSATSTNSVPFANGQMGWLKATFDATTGIAAFYTAPDAPSEPSSWTKLGGDRSGQGNSIYAGTAPMQVGRHAISETGPFLGEIARVIVRNGIAGTVVFDMGDHNVPAGTTTTFTATTGGVGTIYTTAGQTIAVPRNIVQPQPDTTVWRFDANEYPGTGLSYTDPRGRTWTLSGAGAVKPYIPAIRAVPDVKAQIVSYAYAHWQPLDIPPGQMTVPPLDVNNDLGYKMRDLMSLLRPLPGLPFGTPWKDPTTDPPSMPGPWCIDSVLSTDPTIVNTLEETGHTASHVDLSGVTTPLYDTVIRQSLNDGLWYEQGANGNIPLAWDEVNKVWVPRYDPDEWPVTGVGASPEEPPDPTGMSLRLDGAANSYCRTSDANYFDFKSALTILTVMRFDDWTPTSRKVIVSKWGAAGQRSWYWALEPNGTLVFVISRDGTQAIEFPQTGSYGFVDGHSISMGVSFVTHETDLTDPLVPAYYDRVRFWVYDNNMWSRVGTVAQQPNPDDLKIFNSTTQVQIGAYLGNTGNAPSLYRTMSLRGGVADNPGEVGGEEVGLMRGDLTINPTYDRYGNLWVNQGGWSYVLMDDFNQIAHP